MTAFVEFFCDWCNKSQQRRQPWEGYARVRLGGHAEGWDETGGRLHKCPQCIEKQLDSVFPESKERDEDVEWTITASEPPDEPAWPARATPWSTLGRGDGRRLRDHG